MALRNPTPIPHDLWVCDICHGPNLIAIAPSQCPVCGHTRSSCCSNPGDPYPQATGLFPDYSEYHGAGVLRLLGDDPVDIWVCECGSENCDWYDACPLCGRMKASETNFLRIGCINHDGIPYFDSCTGQRLDAF
jgi:rubrerythrin